MGIASVVVINRKNTYQEGWSCGHSSVPILVHVPELKERVMVPDVCGKRTYWMVLRFRDTSWRYADSYKYYTEYAVFGLCFNPGTKNATHIMFQFGV